MVPESEDSVLPTSLDALAVHSPRALFETYNFHDPHGLEELAGWLARPDDDDGPGVAVVAGKTGSGRDYFVRAAAWMAGERGAPVRHVRLSFDGFDPDGSTPLLSFAEHQLRLRMGEDDATPAVTDRKALLTEAAGLLPGGYLGAAAVSVLLNAAISAVDLRALLRSTVPVFAAPRSPSQDHLRSILNLATRGGRLVLVLPADELPEPVVKWFVHEPRRLRRLSVVLSTADVPEVSMLYGEPLGPVVGLGAMMPATLCERVSRRFAPNQFSNWFFSGLWKRSQGVPGQVALAMMTLEHGGWITRDDGVGSPWYLTCEPGHPALVEYFASHFYEQWNQIREGQQLVGLHLVRFVELAALCGPLAPPRLITSYMGLTDKERDELVELADTLEEAGQPVFTSLDYQHPTFRGGGGAPELVYRFADESNRLVVLRRMIHKSQEAQGFLTYLASRVPIVTRANAELFATLSAYLPEGSQEREEYARRLRWWSDSEEAEAFAAVLSEQVRAGKLSIDVLWAAAETREEWTPRRRLALLDAMQAAPDGIALTLLPAYHYTRAGLLSSIGRYREAMLSCRSGLDVVPETDHELRVKLHFEAQNSSKELQQWEDVLWHAREHYQLVSSTGALRGANGGLAAGRMALALLNVDRRQEAKFYIKEAVSFLNEALDDDDMMVGSMLNTLGVALAILGEHERAVSCFRKSVEAEDRLAVAEGSPTTSHPARLYNLGSSLGKCGDVDEAHECLTQSVTVAAEMAGKAHPIYIPATIELFMLDLKRRDVQGAVAQAQQLREAIEVVSSNVERQFHDYADALRVLATALPAGDPLLRVAEDVLTLLAELASGSEGLISET